MDRSENYFSSLAPKVVISVLVIGVFFPYTVCECRMDDDDDKRRKPRSTIEAPVCMGVGKDEFRGQQY
jgi:hypothetical protein